MPYKEHSAVTEIKHGASIHTLLNFK